jgi:hypothetical protein
MIVFPLIEFLHLDAIFSAIKNIIVIFLNVIQLDTDDSSFSDQLLIILSRLKQVQYKSNITLFD